MALSFFRRTVFLFLLVGCIPVLRAQEYKYEIGGMAGSAVYMGDANKNALFKGLNPALGAVFRYNANFRVAFKADLLWGRVSGSTSGLDNVFPDHAEVSFDRNFFELGGQFEFNFFPYSDKYAYLNTKRFTPYVLIGLGATVAPGNGETFAGLNIPMGVGVKYKIMNRLNLGLEFSFRKLFGDSFDVTDDGNAVLDDPYHIGGSALKNKDWYSLLQFSVTWDFGPRSNPCNNINHIFGF